MRMPVTLMMAIGKAALNVAGVGLVGDAAEIGKAAWEYWKKSPEERLDELEAVVRADDEAIQAGAQQVAAELAPGESQPVRMRLATFLKQVPNRIRQSQRRPADPTGRSIRPGFVVSRPEDLIPFVPDQLPIYQPGDRPLAGSDWVLVELLGIGGFGEVWRARNAHFDAFEPVALKFCTDPQTRERLLRHQAKVDARVMQVGRHPGIVRLEATYLSADPPCLQYEYVEGGDLGGLILDWHRQSQKPSPVRVARELLRLAEIVAVVHRIDPPIVHRDLKPANILVKRLSNGEIMYKITDFGIGGIASSRAIQASRQVPSPSQFLTTAVRGAGSYLYASPEQFEGKDPDPRDDVHALGVIGYQMMTGNLTEGPRGWIEPDELIDRGMSAEMVKLLASCFGRQERRPADAAVLAEKLDTLLKPPGREAKKEQEKAPITAKPEPARIIDTPDEIKKSIGMKRPMRSEKPVNGNRGYRGGRLLQFVGLLVLPFGIASELMGRVGLGQSFFIGGAGALIIYVGYVIQNRR
jgi:eukaryotic-like serine/threonine-protein kinase